MVLIGSNVMGPYSINTGITGLGTVPCIPLVATPTINDVNIYVYIRPIDGATGTNILGLATPVYARDGSLLPYSGCMIFDSANIDASAREAADLYTVILHEMAHVFGFGTIWDEKELLVGKCRLLHALVHRAVVTAGVHGGPRCRAGCTATRSSRSKAQGTCRDGTRDGHWSESVLGNELMTGYIGTNNPLSAITSASLRDMSYVVNDAPSDPYTVPLGCRSLADRCGSGRSVA